MTSQKKKGCEKRMKGYKKCDDKVIDGIKSKEDVSGKSFADSKC